MNEGYINRDTVIMAARTLEKLQAACEEVGGDLAVLYRWGLERWRMLRQLLYIWRVMKQGM